MAEKRQAVIVIDDCRRCPSFYSRFDRRISDDSKCFSWACHPGNKGKEHPEFEKGFHVPAWCPKLYVEE